jgi:hypothetical protein
MSTIIVFLDIIHLPFAVYLRKTLTGLEAGFYPRLQVKPAPKIVTSSINWAHGRAVAQAVCCWLPIAAARVCVRTGMWGLWWTKGRWGRVPPSTSVSPANHSTNFSIIIITRGWHNKPISCRSTEWTELNSTPTIQI